MTRTNEGPSAAQQPDDGATREAEATTRLSSIRERRLRFILAEFLIGTPTGKTFDLSEMQLLRDDVTAMLGEITFLRAALSQRPRAETTPDDEEARYDFTLDVLEVLCRVFNDGADEGMQEWLAWYQPSQWLHPSRALGAFIRTRLNATAPRVRVEKLARWTQRLCVSRDGRGHWAEMFEHPLGRYVMLEDVLHELEQKRDAESAPEAGSESLPNEGSALPFSVLDGGDWSYNFTKHELRIGHRTASPELWIEAIRRAVAWPDLPQPSASTTGEADRE